MALAVSGLPTDRFFFAGFLPAKQTERRRAIGEVAVHSVDPGVLRGAAPAAWSLADLVELLGDRPAAVARELTKMFEEGPPRIARRKLAAHYAKLIPM